MYKKIASNVKEALDWGISLNFRPTMRMFPLLCLLFFSSCTTVYHDEAPVKVIDSEEMTWIVQKLMVKYKHVPGRRLKLEHSSLCYDNSSILSLHLEISSQEILPMCAARDLLVDFVEDLLREINSDPIIAGEVGTYPFAPERLDIEINFESFFGRYVDPFYIGCISLRDGMARYSTFDLKDEHWHNWHARVESYTKTRELSQLERAAKEEYDAKMCKCPPSPLEEMFIPVPEIDNCPH